MEKDLKQIIYKINKIQKCFDVIEEINTDHTINIQILSYKKYLNITFIGNKIYASGLLFITFEFLFITVELLFTIFELLFITFELLFIISVSSVNLKSIY